MEEVSRRMCFWELNFILGIFQAIRNINQSTWRGSREHNHPGTVYHAQFHDHVMVTQIWMCPGVMLWCLYPQLCVQFKWKFVLSAYQLAPLPHCPCLGRLGLLAQAGFGFACFCLLGSLVRHPVSFPGLVFFGGFFWFFFFFFFFLSFFLSLSECHLNLFWTRIWETPRNTGSQQFVICSIHPQRWRLISGRPLAGRRDFLSFSSSQSGEGVFLSSGAVLFLFFCWGVFSL